MKALLRLTLIVNLLALPAWADEAKPAAWPMPPMEFFVEQLPAPPKPGDVADQADLNYSLALQADASSDEIRQATIVALYLNVFSYSEVLGPKFTGEVYPQTRAFFKQLEVTANNTKNQLKDHYARLRPVDAHKGLVKELVPYETGYSYPSGHSTRAWLYALILGELDPADRLAFLRQAAQVGTYRVLGGMHYESDVIVARTLAQMLYAQLMAQPDFVKALDALKAAEWVRSPVYPVPSPTPANR